MNERLLRGVLQLSLSSPRLVLAVWACVCAAAAPFVLSLTISTSTDSVLNRGTDSWRFYKESLELFNSDEVLVAAIAAKEPFAPPMLSEVAQLSRELEELKGVRRVDSLATIPLVSVATDGSIHFAPLLEHGDPLLESTVPALRERAAGDPIVADSLLSRDGRVAALNVQLEADLGGKFDEVVYGVRTVVAGHDAWVSGVPVFRAEINKRAGIEIGQFVLLTIAVASAVLFLLLRSAVTVVIALGVGGVGTWVVLAALGATGTSLNLVTVILPSLMLALGCAYSMHLIAASRGTASSEDLERSLAEVIAPTALSGLTTAIGFVAIGAVQIDAVRQVGLFGAFGVLVVVAATLSAVPAALCLIHVGVYRSKPEAWAQGFLAEWLSAFSVRRPRVVVVVSVVVSAVFAAGLRDVEVETDVTKWFPRGSDVRDSYEQIRDRLSGISPMNLVVRSERGPVTSPEILAAMDAMTNHLNTELGVGKAISIVDPLMELHRGFAGGSRASLFSSPDLIEQYMLLLEVTPYVNDLVTADRRAATISLRVDDNGSKALLRLAKRAELWWQAHGPPTSEARMTGIMFEFARAEDEIALGQLRGISFALATIFVLMWAIFRSYRLALIAMLPNLLPLLAVFGVLGLFGVGLDAGLVVSACLVLGIAVDNTIHLVTAFQRAREEELEVAESVFAAIRTVIVPVLLSTLAIGLGFLILGGSGFVFVRNLGLLVAAVMVICCVADLVLLPALLLVLLGSKRVARREFPSVKTAGQVAD